MAIPAGIVRNASGSGYLIYGPRGTALITRQDGPRGGIGTGLWHADIIESDGWAHPAHQRVGLTSSRTLASVARTARDYLNRPKSDGPDGSHYAAPIVPTGGRGDFLDIVSVERMRHPLPGWTARYLPNVDAWHVTGPSGQARTYTRHNRPATPWRSAGGSHEWRRTFVVGRGTVQVARQRVVTPGEPDRVRVALFNATGRMIRSRYFLA